MVNWFWVQIFLSCSFTLSIIPYLYIPTTTPFLYIRIYIVYLYACVHRQAFSTHCPPNSRIVTSKCKGHNIVCAHTYRHMLTLLLIHLHQLQVPMSISFRWKDPRPNNPRPPPRPPTPPSPGPTSSTLSFKTKLIRFLVVCVSCCNA